MYVRSVIKEVDYSPHGGWTCLFFPNNRQFTIPCRTRLYKRTLPPGTNALLRLSGSEVIGVSVDGQEFGDWEDPGKEEDIKDERKKGS